MRDPDPSLMKSETGVRILHCARRWLPAAAFLAIAAVVLLTASLSTAPANAQDAEPAIRYRIVEGLGDVVMLQGRYDEAAVLFRQAKSLAEGRHAEAQIEGKLGELAFKRGDIESAARA